MAIILLSGATGVGTTSVASAIAKEKGILHVVGTDTLREAARQLVVPRVNPYLHRSTYLAGKSANYESKAEDVRRENIIKGFKAQSSIVNVCVNGVVYRYKEEGVPAILEGVHIIPGIYDPLLVRGVDKQILIDLNDEEVHKERLRKRMTEVPTRRKDYLDNFKEIRWIRDYLLRKAEEKGIPVIDNSGNLEDTIRDCLNVINL